MTGRFAGGVVPVRMRRSGGASEARVGTAGRASIIVPGSCRRGRARVTVVPRFAVALRVLARRASMFRCMRTLPIRSLPTPVRRCRPDRRAAPRPLRRRCPRSLRRTGTAAPAAAERPQLVVLVTVDQLRPDYLERWGSEFTGGLTRFWTEGARVHQRARTTTPPPRRPPVTPRWAPDASRGTPASCATRPVCRTRSAPLVDGGRGGGASPFRFRGSSLFDWMRDAGPVGPRPVGVAQGSRRHPAARPRQDSRCSGTPATVASSPAATTPTRSPRGCARSTRATSWARSTARCGLRCARPAAIRSATTSRARTVDATTCSRTCCPRTVPGAPRSSASTRSWIRSPWRWRWPAWRRWSSAAATSTDFLAVSLSTTDAVGHRYGPDSRELHDQVLRVDRYLGQLIDSLYQLRDSSRMLFALSADHGVAPYPELHFAAAGLEPRPGRRAPGVRPGAQCAARPGGGGRCARLRVRDRGARHGAPARPRRAGGFA